MNEGILSEDPAQSKSSFISSVATVLGGQAACAALALITEVCYARLLGPQGRGQISLCMMLIAFGVLVGGLGCDSPIVVWTADSRKKISGWLPIVLLLGLAGSAFACGLLAIVFWHWHLTALQTITTPLVILILATIPVAIFSGYLMAILLGSERFRLRAVVTLADQFAGLAGFVLLLFVLGPKVETAVLGNLVGLVVGAGIIFIAFRDSFLSLRKVPRIDAGIAAGLRMGLRGQASILATTLYYRFDVFLVSFFLGPTQVGLYALGVVVSEALWQIPSAVASALFPRTVRTVDNGASDFTCLIMRQVSVISVVLGVLLVVVCPIAIPLVFGQSFFPSVAVVWWLMPGTVALSMAKVACADLTARYKTGYSTVFAFVALGVSVPLDLVLIPRMGIQGAALTSSVAYIVDAGLLLAALKYELKVRWKSLLVPSMADFEFYRLAWLRYRSWLRSALPPAAGAGEPS